MLSSVRSMGLVGLAIGIALGVAASFVPESSASRNASGTYSLPAGNPVVTGSTISSSWANTTLSDIGTELTSSLDRNGKGAMLAPLQFTAGSASLPSGTKSGDTNTGTYFPAADYYGVTCGGAAVQTWGDGGTSVTGTLVVSGTIAGAATTATAGATTSAGVTATGGTSGSGGVGMTATGGGVNHGATFTGGASTDGGTGGSGVVATGGATNGYGVDAVGTGNGAGGRFTGGSGGVGAVCAAGGGNASGLEATGAGNSAGVFGTGGATGSGGRFAAGTAATSSARQNAVVLTNGDLSMNGVTNPLSTVGFLDTLTPINLIKAWANVSGNGAADGGAAVHAGFNISSATCAGSSITLNFAQPMASADYAAIVTYQSTLNRATVAKNASWLRLDANVMSSGASFDMCAGFKADVMVLGAQ